MPQLDIYTYFTQFQWLLIIFTLLFLLINGQFIPTFQSLFEARRGLLDPSRPATAGDRGPNQDGVAEGGLKVFELTAPGVLNTPGAQQGTRTAPTTSSQFVVSKWDQIYDKGARMRALNPVVEGATGSSDVSNKSNERFPNSKASGQTPGAAPSKKGKAQSNKKAAAR